MPLEGDGMELMFEYARLLCGGRGFAMSIHVLMTAAREKDFKIAGAIL